MSSPVEKNSNFEHTFYTPRTIEVPATLENGDDVIIEVMPRNPASLQIRPIGLHPVGIALKMPDGGTLHQRIIDTFGSPLNVYKDRSGNDHLVLNSLVHTDNAILFGDHWADDLAKKLGLTDDKKKELIAAVKEVGTNAVNLSDETVDISAKATETDRNRFDPSKN